MLCGHGQKQRQKKKGITGKSGHCQKKENWVVTITPTLKEWLKKTLNQKGIIKAGILGHQKGRHKNKRAKIWGNTIDTCLKFSKLCLTVEAKSRSLSDMVLSVCRGNV